MNKIITSILSQNGIAKAERTIDHTRSWVVFEGGERSSVLRIAKTKEASLNVLNEAAWSRVGRPILAEINVTVPEVLDEGREGDLAWVRYERLEGRAFGDDATLTAEALFESIIDRTVEIIRMLDGVRTALPIPLDDPADTETYRQERANRIRENARPMMEAGILTEDEVNQIVDGFSKLMRHYDRRLQHHDILPWHLFDLGGGKLGLIDAEFGGMRVRFYDAAYTLCKLHATVKNDEWTKTYWEGCRRTFGDDGFDEKVMLPMLFTAARELSERHSRGDAAGVDRLKQLVHSVLHERPITF